MYFFNCILLVAKNLSTSIVKKFIPARKSHSRKGDNGIVLVLGAATSIMVHLSYPQLLHLDVALI